MQVKGAGASIAAPGPSGTLKLCDRNTKEKAAGYDRVFLAARWKVHHHRAAGPPAHSCCGWQAQISHFFLLYIEVRGSIATPLSIAWVFFFFSLSEQRESRTSVSKQTNKKAFLRKGRILVDEWISQHNQMSGSRFSIRLAAPPHWKLVFCSDPGCCYEHARIHAGVAWRHMEKWHCKNTVERQKSLHSKPSVSTKMVHPAAIWYTLIAFSLIIITIDLLTWNSLDSNSHNHQEKRFSLKLNQASTHSRNRKKL